MNEEMKSGPSPEEKQRLEKIAQEKEESEWLQDYLSRQPQEEVTTPEEAAELVARFEKLTLAFDAAHSLEALLSIEEISSDLAELYLNAPILDNPLRIIADIKTLEKHNPTHVPIYKAKIERLQSLVLNDEEKRIYNLRMAARKDYDYMNMILGFIKKCSSLPSDQVEALAKRSKTYSNAIGILRNNKIVHDL